MISTWNSGTADDCMSEEILTELADLVQRHPWWQARAHLMLTLLRRARVRPPARVLEVGCGWGVNLEALERRGYRATGLDISRKCLRRLDGPGRELIEHLDDDRAALARMAELTMPRGVLILSVPALPRLHSEFDSIQGHRRRYLPHTLRAAFSGSPFQLERLFWWGAWMVPLLMLQRRSSLGSPGESPGDVYRRYLAVPRWPLSLALRLAFRLDEAWSLHGRPPVGTSLFAVARRSR